MSVAGANAEEDKLKRASQSESENVRQLLRDLVLVRTNADA